MAAFFELARVPVHSNNLVPDRATALEYPTGELRLALCRRCGFIGNAAVDPALMDYSSSYEEAQAYSPRFRAFVDELAAELDARHGLAGRRVLEIGCGKGDFLVALCRATGCSGVGVDPAASERDAETVAGADVRLVRERFRAAHADPAPDLVVCRHTLEHIPDPAAFLDEIHRAAAGRAIPLMLEVPDVVRVLRERAFWDVYYEHCSYFSAGSLARLLSARGWAVTTSRLAYEGQYLLVEAVPGAGGAAPADDVDELERLAGAFARDVGATLDRWRTDLGRAGAEGRRVVLWGAGSKAAGFLTSLGVVEEIRFVVDINPHKQGTFVPGTGQEIVAPEALPGIRPDLVVVMNPVYREEIAGSLAALGVSARVTTVEG